MGKLSLTFRLPNRTLICVDGNDVELRGAGSGYKIQVLDRTFAILDALSKAESPLPLRRVAEETDLHKSTAHRLLLILERHGYVERTPSRGEYRLGLKLLQLGMRFAAGLDIQERAGPVLTALVREMGENAHIGVLRQGQAISIAHSEARHTLIIPGSVGRSWPAHCSALGKAILAYIPDLELDEALSCLELRKFTRKTITTAKALRLALREVRRCGFAVDDGEYEEGLMCIGAPVFDSMGHAIASVAIEGPMTRLGKSRLPSLTESVRRAAAEVSMAMGFTGPFPGVGFSELKRQNRAAG